MPLQFASLFGAGLAIAGALIALLGFRHVWRASSVLRAPHADEPEAADAPIVRYDGAIAGANADGLVEAPFSGTESVVVRHVVEERQINPGVWILRWDVVVEEGVESVPFELDTAEVTATVDGAIGTAILVRETIATVDTDASPPERIRSFLAESDLRETPLLFGSLPGPLAGLGRRLGLGRRTYSEERLEAGDSVTVVGHPVDRGDGETVDPLVVSDRSPWGTFRSMATTGLVAVLLGLPVLVIGFVVLAA